MSLTKHCLDILSDILRYTRMDLGAPWQLEFVMNPHAGTWRQGGAALLRMLQSLDLTLHQQEPDPDSCCGKPVKAFNIRHWVTPGPGGEKQIAGQILQDGFSGPRLVIIAGGDGTAQSLFSSFLDLHSPESSCMYFYRLPLGSGNDNSDADDMQSALNALTSGILCPAASMDMLEIMTDSGRVYRTFNIVSFGLDAYVVQLNQWFRKWIPGNFYSIMVDIGSLFYLPWLGKKKIRVSPGSSDQPSSDQNSPAWYNGCFLIAALGVSGSRQYGAGKKVLPDNDNLCLIERLSIFEVFRFKKLLYSGQHRQLEAAHFTSFNQLQIDYSGTLWMQCDGEQVLLHSSDFPLRIVKKASPWKILRSLA
ncbi:diacylglycerol/lipid kinase family protein [Spirochaeta dissipatitropha]